MTNRSEELIQLSIDGVASPHDQQELERLMSESPDARTAFETTRSLVQELEATDELELPPNFRDEVLAAIRQRQPQPAATILTPHFERKQRKQRFLLLGYAAAAALLIAVSVQPLIRNRTTAPISPSDASGSMSPAGWREVGRAAAGDAMVTVDRRGDVFKVLTSFPPDDGATRIISWDETKLQFAGSSLPAEALSLRPGAATILAQSGADAPAITLRARENARGAAEVAALTLPDQQIIRVSFVID